LLAGCGSPGSAPDSPPGGAATGGSVPVPTVGDGVGDGERDGLRLALALTCTATDAEAPAGACGELAVAVRTNRLWPNRAGTGTWACSPTAWRGISPATAQVPWPGAGQTVNTGDRPAGRALRSMVAWPLLAPVIQTQIA
jgi:hypothetical protein